MRRIRDLARDFHWTFYWTLSAFLGWHVTVALVTAHVGG